jgi:SnoaL-like protein
VLLRTSASHHRHQEPDHDHQPDTHQRTPSRSRPSPAAADAPQPPHPRQASRAGQEAAAFDLHAFSRALEQHDINYQLAHYAPDADIRIVDPDNPPAAPRTLKGKQAIHAWMVDSITHDLGLHVTHLVDGGDRVAFTERSHYSDGTQALTTSTAELEQGLITAQHTILVWEHY